MEEAYTRLWALIAGQIKQEVPASVFDRWFSSVRLIHADEEKLVLSVPDQIYQLWIESNYLHVVHSSVILKLGAPRNIAFAIADPQPVHPAAPPLAEPSANANPAPPNPQSAPDPADPPFATLAPNGLSPRNTFETFVVGDSSRVAHAAALAVAQNPARTYNPLFLHGGVGLGKTHLMQAIGSFVISKRKPIKVVYVSSERFTNEFIDAIQNSTLIKFRKKYRQADVLLIDDIQFLAGRERTQEEFFHTFNTLIESHKQIVLSSDRPPAEISNLEQRLVSRFEWGMTTELLVPDAETRVAILRKKAASMQVKFDDDLLAFIADRIKSNVRRLEGALTRVASYASLHGRSPALSEVEHMLRDILQEEARRVVTVDQIQKKVAEHFDIRIADMTSKRRPANIAFPRQIAMYLTRKLTKQSLSEIGDAFGGRDHGTVLHAQRSVAEKMESDESIRRTIRVLEDQLGR